ncbi:mucin-like protein [Narcine bancroftii]|uniref:mucin-like protein n=1 Tax=Narcine bancroftii TaxID=1343680 RepID=UPI003831D4FB
MGALSFITSLDNSLKEKTEGLLGIWNDNKTDDFKSASGTYLKFDGTNLPNETVIFFHFGLTWKTTENDSVFTYNMTSGETWYTYNNNSFVPKFYDELLQTTEKEKIDKANETCQGNDNCIFDVISTDDPSFGTATLQNMKSFTAQNSSMKNFPPNINGSSSIRTRLNEPVFTLFTATDANNDVVVFSVLTDSPDITITEKGNFSWHPKSSTPIFAIVLANDSKAVSEFGLTLMLCNCSINSTCDYSTPIYSISKNNSYFKIPYCSCASGYTGDYCTEDFDACQDNPCFLNDTCKDQPAPLTGYICAPCPNNLKGDGIKCFDLDECLENISSCEQICTNVIGTYNCSCYEGYTRNAMNHSLCTDIDECLDDKACSNSNSICSNTEGSFSCVCKPGYEGPNCTVINECKSCSPDAICNPDGGNYTCKCNQGYRGDGMTCTALNSLCKTSQCSPSFCNNGGTCVINSDNCKPDCQCLNKYSGEQCQHAARQFAAEALPSMPKRSVNITLRLQGVNATVISRRDSPDFNFLVEVTTRKVYGILSKIQKFAENTKPVFWLQGETEKAAVVASFTYDGTKANIDYLNNELLTKILNTFNNLHRFRRNLDLTKISFESLSEEDLTDVTILSVEELLKYLSCNGSNFEGYTLQWSDKEGAICQSACESNYCMNEAECEHLTTGPLCKCVDRIIYSSYGIHCENLSIKLGPFFGILFGALGFLLIVICLIVWTFRPSKKERRIDDANSYKRLEKNGWSSEKNHINKN